MVQSIKTIMAFSRLHKQLTQKVSPSFCCTPTSKQILNHLGFTNFLKASPGRRPPGSGCDLKLRRKVVPGRHFCLLPLPMMRSWQESQSAQLLTESQYEHSFVLVVRCLTESGALKTRWSLSPNVCLSCWWKKLVPVLLVTRIQILVLLEVGEPPWEDVADYSCLLHLGMEAARSRGSRDSWPTSAKQGLKSQIQSSAVGGELWKWSRGGIDRVSGEALGIGESVVYWSWTKRQAA